MLLSQPHDYLSCSDEGLFVGEGYGLACFHRSDSGFKTAEANHRGEYDVYVVTGDEVAYGLHAGEHFYEMWLKGICYFLVFVFVADHHCVGVKLNCLAYEQVCAVVGCEKFHFEKVSMLSDDIQSLASYRSCGA